MSLLRLPNFWLLAALILLFLVTPFLSADSVWTRALFSLLLVSAVYVARHRRVELIGAGLLALIWLLLSWADIGGLRSGGTVVTDLVLLALLALTLGLVLIGTFSHGKVTADTLCGATAVYLLIGTTWAVSYGVLETLQPGSFSGLSEGVNSTWAQFLYFSLTTLTTLGYGDITPTSAPAQIWANLEAVTGVLYLTILVARLVSLYRH